MRRNRNQSAQPCYVLKKWRKEGILKGKEKRDRIADHEQLMQIAEHIRQFYDIP